MMKKRVLSVLLCIVMVVGLFPINSLAVATQQEESVFSDMPSDWSTKALQNAVSNGLLKGSDGKIMPDENLTRAQMAAVIARAFGSTVKGNISAFSDVKTSDWFAEDMAMAYQMGVIKGAEGRMNPNSAITRQEVFVIISRALKLAPAESMNKTFSDTTTIDEWAKGEVYALVNAGYIQGSEGKLSPTALITRAQFAQVLDNIIKQYIKEAGEVFSVVSGNVMINTPGVILKNLTVNGDLIIGDGVGDGEITLDNVKVTGRMVVRGGGENSVIIKGASSVSNMVVARVDGKVSVKVEGDADVEVIYIDDGSDDVNIVGTVGTIEVNAADIKLSVAQNSTVATVRIREGAANVALEVSGTVSAVTTSASGTAVTGNGTVTRVEAQNGANGAVIQTPKTEIVVASGVTGVKGGGGTAIDGGSTKTNNDNGTGIAQAPASGGGSTGGGSSNVAVTGITVPDASVQAGSTLQMAATVSPAYATNQAVTWSVTNGTGTASISASGLLSAASVGTVTVTATAADGSGVSDSATVTITAVPDANLTGLVLSGTPNDFTFSATTYNYAGVYVPHNQSSVTVTPTLAGATITVNGTAVASGSASAAINLTAAEEQTITVAVSKTGHTSKTYTIHITRIPVWTQGSTIGDITLGPSGTITYGPASGTYTINGNLTIQGSASGTITLQNIRVTGDMTVNTPNATITVQPTVTIEGSTNIEHVAADTFNSQGRHNRGIGVMGGGRLVLGGTAGTVPVVILTTQPIILQGDILFVQVPPSQNGAQLTLGGTIRTLFAQGSGAQLTLGSGGALGGVIIPAGGSGPAFSGWGGADEPPTPTVTEAAGNLTGLTISSGTLSPAFAGSTYLYKATVANGVDTITVAPTHGLGTATVKVGGVEQVGGVVPLSVGQNTITIEVTQAGRTMISYTLVVRRQAAPPETPTITPASGAVAFGTELTMTSAGADFIFYTTDGSDPLGGVVDSTKVYNPSAKPVINAAMTVKAIAVKAGSPNSGISSPVIYTQAATADLIGLALSGTPLNYTFAGATYTYNGVTVANGVESITVTPTGAGTITVEGTVVASGSASAAIALMTSGDVKTITVVVTETGKTPKTYTINIARELNGDATVASSASHYTVNNTLNTIAANETFINTATTVSAFLGSLTKNEATQWKVVSSAASISDADDFNAASAKATTAALETGDQLAVMAQNGTIKVYAITVTGLISSTLNVIIPEQDGIVISLFKTVETVDSLVSGLVIGDFLLIKDFGLPGSQEITATSLYIDPMGGTFEYEILPSGQTFAAGNYRLAFIKDGYQVAHEDFTILDSEIAAAKSAIENAAFEADQVDAEDIDEAASNAQSMVNTLLPSSTTATFVRGTFTAAIAGTVADADGTNGSFTFTVSLTKGFAAPVAVDEQTMTITATPYDTTQDNADIASAVSTIQGATYTATQAEAGTSGAAETKAQALVNALSLSGAAAAVVPGTFTAATAGTVGDADGTNGSFTFTVTVSKGLGTPVTTAQQTMTITATPYDTTQDNADILAAQSAIEGATYTATQAEAGTSGAAETKAQALVNALSLSGTTATVVPGTFTAATAGTVGDADGTNGSFTFTVTVSKGLGTPVTTAQQTMTITATPYDAPPDTEITGYDALASVDAGTAGSATYLSAAEVMTYLGTSRSTATISGTAVTVPLINWTDTQSYNPAVAGSYTFTANIDTLPDGYVDAVDTISTVTVEVVVSALSAANLTSLTENLTASFDPVFAGGTYAYSLEASSSEQGVGLTATLDGATITYSYTGQPGKVVASGTIESIPLVVGTNTITIQVAKAGLSTATYTLTVTKAAPFTAGSGTLGTYSDFTPTANTFPGLYISKNDRESDGSGGVRSVVDIYFPAPSAIGATSYTMQFSTDGGSSWSNFQYDSGTDLTASADQDNFSLNILGTYKFRLLASGGAKSGYVSNVIDVTTANTPTSAVDTRFSGWGLDESMTITGTMAPWVGRGLESSFTVVTIPAGGAVSGALTYEWYRVNPETFEMIPIAGTTSATYTTSSADVGYRIMVRAAGDGVTANGFIQVISNWDILEPNKAYLSNVSATGFTINLFKPAALTEANLVLTDGSAAPVAFTLSQVNGYTYNITADIASTGYNFRLINDSAFWRVAEEMMPGHVMEGIGLNLSPSLPPSNDATLASATVKSAAATLGTQSDNINSISGGAVTLTSAQVSNASLSTAFSATDGNAMVKAVKYVHGITDFSGFDAAAAYNDEAISDGDFFIIRVTAEDTVTVSYYKITVTVNDTVTPLSGADVSISSGSVIFGYTFQSAGDPVTYGEALAAPYYLNAASSTVTLTNGTGSVSANLSDINISASGTVTYENVTAIQADFDGLIFIPSQILLNLVGATTVNGGADQWTYNVTVNLDPAEIALFTPDTTPPTVTASEQTVTNEVGQVVTARSSEAGTIFIILDGEPHATQLQIQAALAAFKASAKEASTPDTDVSISTTGLTGGTYHAYAVDTYGNISAAGANAITVTQVIAPGGGADKSVLNTALFNAGANKSSVTVSVDGTDVYATKEWVTTEVITAYEGAISSAQAVADNGSATQAEIDGAVGALAGATLTFNSAKQPGTKLCVTSVTLRNATDDVTATLGVPLAANIGDVLEITAVTVSDGSSAVGHVEYFVVVRDPISMEQLGTIDINAALNSFTIPATYTHVEIVEEVPVTTYPSIEGKLIHFGARLLTDANSGAAAAAGPIEAAEADQTPAPLVVNMSVTNGGLDYVSIVNLYSNAYHIRVYNAVSGGDLIAETYLESDFHYDSGAGTYYTESIISGA